MIYLLCLNQSITDTINWVIKMDLKILDNKKYGNVGDELKENITQNSKLSIISLYFTIFAYKELQKELNKIEGLRFPFREPSFSDNSKEIQNQIDIVELTIDESKKEIKKEDNFSRKLELNMKIKIVEEKIQQLVDEILV